MLILNLPKSFKIGDTIDYRTPDETMRITWRDARTLVIEPDDVRVLLFREGGGGPEELAMFTATDKGVDPSEYSINVLRPAEYEPEAPAILIDARRRRVRLIQIKPSAISYTLLDGEERLAMAHYRRVQLGHGDVMFYLPAAAYWSGCLQPEHRHFFKIGDDVSEPHAWRALVTCSGIYTADRHKYKSNFKRMVQFIDEPTARALTDAALEKVELMAAALSGQAVPRWRPWDTAPNPKTG